VQLHDLLDRLEIVEVRGHSATNPDAVEIDSVTHDSRRVGPGALFCCIPGDHVDGHAFAPDAVAAGASACMVERWVDVEVPQVKVSRVRVAIGPVAARICGDPSEAMRVLGVTGTNGKTTTTYLLEAIAREAGERAGVIGTTGARVEATALPLARTTPEAPDLQTLLATMREAGAETVAMEVSSHALDQHRVDGTRFAAVCFTNLTHDHLDYHGSLGAYFDAKARLFTPLFTSQVAVGIDDEHGPALATLARKEGLSTTTYALGRDADVTVRDLVLEANGSRFTIDFGDVSLPIEYALVGRFNVINALGAAATARAAGFAPVTIADALSREITVPGRMERVDAGQDFTVLVDYAHTPAALQSVLHAGRGLVAPGGRLVVVFGCGGDRDQAKRPVMGALAAELADIAIVTNDNPRSEDPAAIAAEILGGVPAGTTRPAVELDRRAAIRAAVTGRAAGDVVVIAGKGHEQEQDVNGVRELFDDRAVAREELKAGA
jgi:UDP-N-acetylmuramoyl-L-alanyl-D-glutamate--2,6-diaminopimelate ligase